MTNKGKRWVWTVGLSLGAMYLTHRASTAKSRRMRTFDLIAADVASITSRFFS